jgi:ADP-heptose:LPS heptosyltransferase
MGTEPAAPVVLALRALKLGDLLVAVPALRGLRAAFPEHRLVLAAPGWLAPIVALVDAVDQLLPTPGLRGPLPLPPKSVDVAVNLHGNGLESRGALEALEPRRRVGHLAPAWDGPAWADGIHERTRWTRLLQWHSIPADPGDLYLDVPDLDVAQPDASVLHVGAFYGSRQWPVDRFAAVAKRLAAEGHRVVFTGSADDRPRALAVAELAGLDDRAVLAGELALDEFAAAVAAARLVVSADTGAAHLASAFHIPSVVLFGPAPPQEWGPPPGPHIVLTDEALRRGETFSSEPDPALLAVQPADVLAALAELAVL